MKYVQPYGIADPDAHYVNGDPSQARMGSIPPAEAFEHPMRELVAVIDYSTLVPDEDDLEQLAKSVRSQRMNYSEDTGSVNVLSVAYDPPITEYSIGLPLNVKIKNTNTGPTSIDAGAGRVPIRKPNGAETASGDLPAGGLAALVYDGTVFQMINFGGAGAGGAGDTFLINIPYTVDTSPTPNTVIANFSPAITSLQAGTIIMVKIANTNNTFANINVNGLGLKPIYAQGGIPSWPLLPGDMMTNDVLVFTYDGTAFWIYANTGINQNVTLPVNSITQINQVFAALGRKRVSTTGSVTVKLAGGTTAGTPLVYDTAVDGRFTTYHADSDRIILEGTMFAGQQQPISSNFVLSGVSPAARANDTAINLQMLRGKYASEIRFNNDPGGVINHLGPGKITYKNLLLVGSNTPCQPPGNETLWGINLYAGPSAICDGVSICASGGQGFNINGGSLECRNCYCVGCWGAGFVCGGSGFLSFRRGGGAYSGNQYGLYVGQTSTIYDYGTTEQWNTSTCPGIQVIYNALYGAAATNGASLTLVRSSLTGNSPVDIYAVNFVFGNLTAVGYSTISPAINTMGNNNSMIVG
jgi:hypothetical protein